MPTRKRSKRYRKAAELVDPEKSYSLDEAIGLVKKFPAPKFDPTVTVSMKLGVDPRNSEQMVRGTCPLPHGTGKEVRVLVFAQGGSRDRRQKRGSRSRGLRADDQKSPR